MTTSQDGPTSLSGRAIRGIMWVGLEKWWSRLLSLLVFGVLGRLLAPEDFGLMAISVSVTAIIAVFVEGGMAQALVQRRKLREVDAQTAFWTSMATAVLLYLVLLALTPVFVATYSEPRLSQLIPVSGLVLPLAALSSAPAALLERELRFKALAIRNLTGAVVGALIAITIAVLGGGVWALAIQPVATSAVATVVLWASARWRPRFMYSRGALRGIWAFSVNVVLIEFFNAMQSNVDKFIVGAYFSPTVLGYYFIAQRIMAIVMDVVATVLAKVSLTTLSRLQDQPARLLAYFNSLTFGSAVIALPIFGLLIPFGGPVTQLLFGDGWEKSVPLMALIAPSAMLASVTSFDKSVLLARGQGRASLGVAVGQFLFGTAALLIAAPFGVLAVAAARSIRQFLFWPARLWALRKYAGLSVVAYLRQFVSPTLGTVIVIGLGTAFMTTPWADAPLALITFLLPASSICLLCYGLTIWLTARRKTQRIWVQIRRSLPSRRLRTDIRAVSTSNSQELP